MLEVRAHYPWKAECTQSENNINQETFIFQNWYENEKATNFDSKVTNVTKKKDRRRTNEGIQHFLDQNEMNIFY